MRKKSRDLQSYSPLTIALFVGMALAVVAYLYFLNLSVVEVVLRTEHVHAQGQLRTEIAMLEGSYIEAQHTIAARIASLEDYNTEVDKIFLSRADSNLVLLED